MNRKALALCVLSLVILSGCSFGSSPRPISVGFSEPSMQNLTGSQADQYRIEGNVTAGVRDGETIYRNVVVCLYSADGRLLDKSSSLTLRRANGWEAQVALETETVPDYLIINASVFWETPALGVGYYEFVPNQQLPLYQAGMATEPSDLPFQGCTAGGNSD